MHLLTQPGMWEKLAGMIWKHGQEPKGGEDRKRDAKATTYLCIIVCRKRSAAGEVPDCEAILDDFLSQDLLDGEVLPGFLPTARSVRVGTTLELLAALSKCDGRGRRNEFCLERRDN